MSSPTFVGLRGQSLVYAVTLCSGLGFLLFGYDLAFMGGATTSPDFLRRFNNPGPSLLGFFVSSYEVGAMIGAAYIFLFGDRYGRKPNVVTGAIIISVGAVLQASAYSTAQFLVGRIVAGFGLGMMTTVIPVWMTECAMPKSRGRMVAMQLSNLILGLIVANWLVYGMSAYTSSIQWRFPCAFQIAFCLIIGCYMPFLPESPRYLVREGRLAEAERSLSALRGVDDVVQELAQIKYANQIEAEAQGGWMDVFKQGDTSARTRVMIGFWVNCLQQLTGCNLISSFGPYVYENLIGMSRHDALITSGVNQVWYFLSSLTAWWAVDRFGRRKLFMFGSTGMTICTALSAIFIGLGGKGFGYGAIVVSYLFFTFFTLGWQSNMWVYPSELLPLRLRVKGGAIAVISQWAFTFLIVEITPSLIQNLHWKSYVIFAVFNAVSIPIAYFFFPETNQMPLEAVDLLFARDGRRPGILTVVRESANKEIQEEVRARLKESGEVVAAVEEKTGAMHVEATV